MTPTEIKSLMDVVYAQWPEQRNSQNIKNLATLWNATLADIPYELAKQAVVKILCTSKWFPKVNEIREAALDMVQGQPITWGEAWDMARHNGWMMEGLPKVVRETIYAIGYWQLSNSTNQEAMRAQWRDIYQDKQRQRREHDLLPAGLQRQLENSNNAARLITQVPQLEEA